MSDDDMDMMYDDDDVNEDQGEEEGAELQTQYYEAKGLMEDSPKEATAAFEKVLTLEKEKGEWGFKALKKLTKLYFNQQQFKKAADKLKTFMTYTKNTVSSNEVEKGINSILDLISTAKDLAVVEELFAVVLEGLKKNGNERIWFRTNLRFGKLLFDLEDYTKLNKVLQDLHKTCLDEKGEDDLKKGGQLVDIYALEIQMYTATKNNKKLKDLYYKALEVVKSAIPHPRIMGIIRECGGKMHMREREWEKSHTDFFEAFKCYDEAGIARRIQCLKYLVLANMLMNGLTNPFDAPEAKPYKSEAEIVAMLNLITAYEKNDIKLFEKTLKDNKKSILDDPFMKDYIDDLMKNIRTQVLLKIVGPYSRIKIPFLSTELNISPKEVEELLVGLILDAKVQGKIDQVNQVFELSSAKSSAFWKYKSIDRWATQLASLHTSVVSKLG